MQSIPGAATLDPMRQKGIFLFKSSGTHGHRDGTLRRTWLPNHICASGMGMGTGRSLGCGVGMMHPFMVSPTELIQQHMGNLLHLKGNEK